MLSITKSGNKKILKKIGKLKKEKRRQKEKNFSIGFEFSLFFVKKKITKTIREKIKRNFPNFSGLFKTKIKTL